MVKGGNNGVSQGYRWEGIFPLLFSFAELFWVLYTIRYTIGARIKGRFYFCYTRSSLERRWWFVQL